MDIARALLGHYDQHRFTVLFVLLFLTIAGHGFVGELLPVANPLDWLLGISLVAIVFSVRRRGLRWVLGGLAMGSVAARLLQGPLHHPAPAFLSQSLLALTCLLAAGMALRRALASGRVNAEHICAALDTYLLAGVAFGIAYCLMEAALPGSFASDSARGLTPPRAIYFSFVTQATLGFGDIVPITEHAQGVVVAQGVGGQMYLAVLVARLVSLYSAQERS
jgi:voltage-gated potassium channel